MALHFTDKFVETFVTKLSVLTTGNMALRKSVGCVAQLAERRSLAGELTLSCARPSADG